MQRQQQLLLLFPTVVDAKLPLGPGVTYGLMGGHFNRILIGTHHVGLVPGEEAAMRLLASIWECNLWKCC